MKFPESLNRTRLEVESSLDRIMETVVVAPASLKETMSYSLKAGGKRLRPVMCISAFNIFSPSEIDPMPAACALEFIHTYSLIHDDLPAMDNDDFRRGMPTSHKKFGEAAAILAGDALVTEAFNLIASAYRLAHQQKGIAVIAEIASAAGSNGMVGGQVLDTLNTNPDAKLADIEKVHRFKTGALIRASIRSGAILGGADDIQLTALTRYAEAIGLAFQVVDDILDVTSTVEELGKSIGKDAAQHKVTYVTLLGLEESRRYAKRLIESALAELARFGAAAEPLRDLALFTLERKT